jgi:hypothetical protein
MAAKSFEEQVREELEVVRLQPDVSVWENVSAALTRRRRRFGIFWLLPALVTAGIVWGIIEWKKPSSTPVIVTHQQTSLENKKTVNPSSQNREKISGNNHEQYAQAGTSGSTKGNMSTATSAIPGDQQTVTRNDQEKPVHQSNQDAGSAALFSAEGITTTSNKEKETSEQQAITDTAAINMVLGKQDLPVSDTQKTAELTQLSKDSANQSVSPATVHVPKTKHPWLWQVSAIAGISGAGNPATGKDMLSYSSPNNAQYNPGSGNNISGIAYRLPTEKGGMYFSARVHAIKQLDKKWSFGLHAGYAAYTNTIGVGRRYRDSSNFVNYLSTDARSDNGYVYLSTDSIPYTNRYHYLLAGVDIYRNIALGNSMLLRWGLSADAGILLSSNALYFDKNAGLLYHNNALLSKMQFSISSGIDLGFGRKPLIYAGPQFGYALSGTSGNHPGKHLWYFGLRISAGLPEKRSGMQR